MKKSVLFLTVGDINWASSRIRSYWPAEIMEEADAAQWQDGAQIPDSYDVYIWMKTADIETMERHKQMGKISFVEVCDPSWWWQPELQRQIANLTTAVVAASEPAAKDYRDWYNGYKRVYTIPDRLKLEHYGDPKFDHSVKRGEPVKFIWYGAANNRVSIFAALAYMERLASEGVKVSLTVMDNLPNHTMEITNAFPVYHVGWSLDKEVEIIKAHDVVLLPPYPGPWGKIKTPNKRLTAWACGLPVVSGEHWETLYNVATCEDLRQKMAQTGLREVWDGYTIDKTAEDWRRVIETERKICNT